ncbi:copper/silver-translocating P-type ATPase,heavy metal-translocating P-type ATPase, Cd/Co/Hg/Pb/Zn-transporting [Halobacteroides halobius DSM 5150]|uniref:Cd(2+)-exporting ATPase n=1 Tax=Halobacteroides halobius (strain ATCC 35273 / DSM 5150 / MD-1) TaxID=748449 RepID=L0K820_HALHC|nr:cation-translocating P-type ATPase [Halobacteroides halobius]AGB41171.1 copper/silver-translocating P-type ATPase,heavy metal-translocating P-type ATPase, Cd/Co/Hg/Pb/Zn-transporting [Halobacteroides halobius DSM 5150]
MKKKLKITSLAGILIAIGWLAELFNLSPLIFNGVMILASIVAGYQVAINAFNTLKMGVLSINTLVTIAAGGALVIGEYWEAAAVTFLFVFGSYLEARTMNKTRNAIKGLMELSPSTATVVRKGKEEEIPARDVIVGEKVIIRPGEKIPIDGQVITGESEVNQASITGESKPVAKKQGDEVYSGTINKGGYLEVEAEKVGQDTTFARIIQLVEEAQEEKAPTQELMEKFSQYYTPGIILLAIIAYLITWDIRLALTLLVIGCPGALVISTPISIVSGIGNAARNGVLIKGGEHLETAGDIDCVAFDKTGTLTQGQPEVTDIIAVAETKKNLLATAASAELNSEHHLAQAILNEVKDQENLTKPNQFSVITGKGVQAQVNDQDILVGNRKLLAAEEIKIADDLVEQQESLEREGKTVVFVTKDKQILGLIAIADTPRAKATQTISKLKELGIKKVLMLTGDNQRIAATIAEQLGLDDYRADLLPEEKVTAIKELQQEYTVAMVGDGINDAPALATADTGIAMGAAGTDAAIDTADITLMADKLTKLPFALGLSKATNRNIKQNVIFAVGVVFALLAGVLGKEVFLASGMLIHELSVLLVIFNAMRLLRYKIN